MLAPEFSHHTTAVDGQDVHYVTAGSGEPVVLLHGWPTTWMTWKPLFPGLVAAGYQVVAVDTPGLGDSAPPAQGYARLALAQTIRELVDALGLGRVHLAGHDLGGQIAFAFGLAFPEKLRTLAILAISIAGLPARAGGGPWHWGLHQVPGLIEELAAGRERTYLGHFYSHTGRPGAFPPEQIEEYVRAYSRPGAFHRGIEYYRTRIRDAEDNRELIEKNGALSMPVHWIGGGKAAGASVGTQLEKVATNLSGHIISDAGHWLPQECPDEVAKLLIAFWRGAAAS